MASGKGAQCLFTESNLVLPFNPPVSPCPLPNHQAPAHSLRMAGTQRKREGSALQPDKEGASGETGER